MHCVDLKEVIGGPHEPLQPIHIVVNYSLGILHPHLSGSTTDYWPFQVTSEADAEQQRGILATIVEVELHQRVFETNWRILPLSEGQREEEDPDLEEAIRQAGYESRIPLRLGRPESSFCIEVYTSQKGENAPSPHYPYFVGVQMPTEYECIYVTDFPSLVSLLGQLGIITDKVRDISE